MFNKEFENKEILINGFRTYLENRNTKGIHCISSILRCSFFPHILISKTSHRPGFRSSYCREELLSPASHLGALWVWDHSNSPKVFFFFLDNTGNRNLDCKPESVLADHSVRKEVMFYSLCSVPKTWDMEVFLFCPFLWTNLLPF